MRFDPFREFDRIAQELDGCSVRFRGNVPLDATGAATK